MSYFGDIEDFPVERDFPEIPPVTIKYKNGLGEITTEINGQKQVPGEWEVELAKEILEEIMENEITAEEIKVLSEIVRFFLPDENIDIDADIINKDWNSIVGDIKNSISQMSFDHLVETIPR